jgi:DNA repair protein RadA/Sms
VRAVSQAERRIVECQRLGFDHVLLPRSNMKNLRIPDGMTIVGVDTISQAIGELGLFDRD